MKADMIVLDRDIYSIDPADIGKTKVRLTVFDGKIVHGNGDSGAKGQEALVERFID